MTKEFAKDANYPYAGTAYAAAFAQQRQGCYTSRDGVSETILKARFATPTADAPEVQLEITVNSWKGEAQRLYRGGGSLTLTPEQGIKLAAAVAPELVTALTDAVKMLEAISFGKSWSASEYMDKLSAIKAPLAKLPG